jgi:hypothetical protein
MSQKIVPDRCAGERYGIVGTFGAIAPAIQDAKDHRTGAG